MAFPGQTPYLDIRNADYILDIIDNEDIKSVIKRMILVDRSARLSTVDVCKALDAIYQKHEKHANKQDDMEETDFQVIKQIGAGAISKVYHVIQKKTKLAFAMKKIDLSKFTEKKQK